MWSDVKDMLARYKPLNPEAAVWVANIDTLPQLLGMYQPAGDAGVPVYVPGSQNNGLNTLCGWPLIFSEASASCGTNMDLVLFDPTAYLLVEKARVGIQTAYSVHVRFEYAESALRFIYRCNGQPLFASAISPFKGSDSVSPYVAISTRT